MWYLEKLVRRFGGDTSGNIALTAALTSPILVGILALGVDYGYLTVQKREAQQAADLAAISGVADINNPEQSVAQYFKLNNLNLGVVSPAGLITANGVVPFDPQKPFTSANGYAEVIKGRYEPDPNIAVGQRFVPNATPTNALKVTITEKGQIFFAGAFASAPTISASGTASGNQLAAFSIGSRLTSVNNGLLNAILGGLLGTTVNLNVMDYNALIDADINALQVLNALALDLNLTAGTYKDLLNTDITYGKLLSVLGKTTGVKPAVATVLKTLERAANKTQLTLKLAQVLNLGPVQEQLIGAGDNLKVMASVFDLLNASAIAANGGQQIAVDLGAGIPGLASTKIKLAIGEAPVGTPALAVGGQGTIVRTAQTRLSVEVAVDGLSAIAGLRVRVPIYIDLAQSEARLAAIRCTGGGQGTVDVDVVPGAADIALGDVDTSAFNNFGKTPRVVQAAVVDSALLKILGKAQITASNMTKTKVTFSQADITQGTVKNVSTKDTATSLIQSLLKNLDLDIKVLFLTLGTPTLVTSALADTLSLVTKPLDTVLYNTLLVLGIKIGEADVRVTDVRCMQPALVQ